MNFYKCISGERINPNDYNVYLWDDLLDYIDINLTDGIPGLKTYKSLYRYSDSILATDDVKELIVFFKYILENKLINDYEDSDDAINAIKELIGVLEGIVVNNSTAYVMGD